MSLMLRDGMVCKGPLGPSINDLAKRFDCGFSAFSRGFREFFLGCVMGKVLSGDFWMGSLLGGCHWTVAPTSLCSTILKT